MTKPDFNALLHKYNAGEATEQERKLIEQWYGGFEFKDLPALTEEQIAEILSIQPIIAVEKRIIPLWRWVAAAAVLLMFITAALYFNNISKPAAQVANTQTDALPGSNKAILTLNNGRKIVLNQSKNGKVANQGQIQIVKSAAGQVTYTTVDETAGEGEAKEMLTNTITTPRGGQYRVVLADGTTVWLNAASSITYPVQFTGADRRVAITGEAYFEVSHDKSHPFKVSTGTQVIEVLGTHFNVNSYTDEPALVTTLLEGSVKVSALDATNATAMLKPGERSVFMGGTFRVAKANIEQATDWINGDFVFDNQTLPQVLRKISRWYDVDVDYGSYNKNLTFSGVVSRSKNLSAVLIMLELTQTVKFSVQGKSLRVIK